MEIKVLRIFRRKLIKRTIILNGINQKIHQSIIIINLTFKTKTERKMESATRTQEQAIMIADAMHISKELRTNNLARDKSNTWKVMDALQVRIEGRN